MNRKLEALQKRKRRVRIKIRSLNNRLRLSVLRSNRYIYAQIIDDQKGKTVVSAHERELTEKKNKNVERAYALGKLIAKKAKKKKIDKVVFDRGSFAYHGRVKALADGAREGGLLF